MQLAMVVITSSLVLAVCAGGQPEGEVCVFSRYDISTGLVSFHSLAVVLMWLQKDY